MARTKTGLDKTNSILPIVIIGVTIAIVIGLILGALWGLASSGKKSSNVPGPVPTLSTTSTSPTPTMISTSPGPSASPTLTTSPTPTATPSASPTLTTSPTPAPTTPGGVPPYPAGGVARTQSGHWNLNYYGIHQDPGTGKFVVTAHVVNTDRQPRVGYFTLYLYSTATQAYLGTASATAYVPPETASPQGVAVTFASSTNYVPGATLIFVAY